MTSVVGLTEILNVTVTPAPGSVQDTNLKQVAGNAVDTGAGASGAGTQRVAVSSDSAIKITDGTNTATIGNLTNNKPLATMIVDGAGTQITSFGGGTQYAQGTAQASPTGTVAMGKNPSNVINALSTDASGNLNVNLAAGSISGGNAAAGLTGSAVPTYADYTGFNSGGNLVGVSAANPLPVTASSESLNAITGSLSANGNLISTDTAGYNSISVQITGNWEANITFMVSNDNVNWVNVQGYAFNTTMVAIDSVEDNDIYVLPVIGRYFKAVVSGYQAGTIGATAYLRAQSLAGIGEASLTQAMDQTTGTPINIGFKGFQGPGQQPAAYSLPVALPNEQVNDLVGFGAPMLAGYTSISTSQNVLASVWGSGAPLDCLQYKYIYIVLEFGGGATSATSSACVFEYSNDNVTWSGTYLTDLGLLTTTTNTALLGSSINFPSVVSSSVASNPGIRFGGAVPGRYFRVRPTSTVASITGSVGGWCRLSYRLSTIAPSYPQPVFGTSSVNITQLNGSTFTNNFQNTAISTPGLLTGGSTNSYYQSTGPFTQPVNVRNVTDRTGSQTVAGVAPYEAENPNTNPVNVRLERTTNGQESVQDLLQQILVELRANNYYTKETPTAVAMLLQTSNAVGIPASMQDDPENFFDDPSISRLTKGH